MFPGFFTAYSCSSGVQNRKVDENGLAGEKFITACRLQGANQPFKCFSCLIFLAEFKNNLLMSPFQGSAHRRLFPVKTAKIWS